MRSGPAALSNRPRNAASYEAIMTPRFLAAIAVSAVIGLAANVGAQAACGDDDIAGEWTWEVTAYLNPEIYTFVCPVLIRPDRTFKPADCKQVDNKANSPQGSLTVGGK